jgi:hypothetical protein
LQRPRRERRGEEGAAQLALAADARKLPGVCPPLGFFDPLGLCFTTASEVKRMREAEARVNSSAARSRL